MRTLWQWVRDIHLWTGVFSTVFLGVYAWSSMQVSHNTWFDLKPRITESRITLPTGLTARQAAAELRTARGLQGDLIGVRETPKGVQFRLALHGRVDEFQHDPATGAAAVKTSRFGPAQLVNRLHFMAGLWHEAPAMNLIGAYAAAVSAALLVLGLSGILLWFRMKAERRIGYVLLAVSLAWGLGLAVSMRLA
jgi:hypothetical protein